MPSNRKKKPAKARTVPIERFVEANAVVARVLLRADAVYDLMVVPYSAAADEVPDHEAARGTFSVTNGPIDIFVGGAFLYLALAWQVIATWRGLNTGIPLANPEVDAAFDAIDIDRLKDFRNSVLHTSKIDDAREAALMDDADAVVLSVRGAMEVVRECLRKRLGPGAGRLA